MRTCTQTRLRSTWSRDCQSFQNHRPFPIPRSTREPLRSPVPSISHWTSWDKRLRDHGVGKLDSGLQHENGSTIRARSIDRFSPGCILIGGKAHTHPTHTHPNFLDFNHFISLTFVLFTCFSVDGVSMVSTNTRTNRTLDRRSSNVSTTRRTIRTHEEDQVLDRIPLSSMWSFGRMHPRRHRVRGVPRVGLYPFGVVVTVWIGLREVNDVTDVSSTI